MSLEVSVNSGKDVTLWERYAHQFPVRERLTYLNHAAVAPLSKPAADAMKSRGYKPHVRQRGEEIAAKKRHSRNRPKRWVVERTHSWINRFRKLLVRFEKTEASYLGLLELACALIIFRKVVSIYG